MNRRSIKEIAALAGVSIGTVDRVLHDRGRVAPETEARVRNIIRELDFKPNMFASTLKTGKTFRLGVLMPRPGPFCEYWELPLNGVRKAEQELAHLNVRIERFLFDINSSPSAFAELGAGMNPDSLDGLIMAPVLTEAFQKLIAGLPQTLPLVFIDSFLPRFRPLTVIAQDSHQAGRVAGHLMNLLLPMGGEVVVIRNLPSDFHLMEREKGFIDFLDSRSRFQVCVEEVDLAKMDGRIDEGVDAIHLRHPQMAGLFVTNANTHPFARLSQPSGKGKRIALLGFDLIKRNIAGLLDGSIDFVISQKPEEYGYLSVTTLYRHLILKEAVPAQIHTPIDIVCRENLV